MHKHRHQRKNPSTKRMLIVCAAVVIGIFLYLLYTGGSGRDKNGDIAPADTRPAEQGFGGPNGPPRVNGPTSSPPSY